MPTCVFRARVLSYFPFLYYYYYNIPTCIEYARYLSAVIALRGFLFARHRFIPIARW